MTPDDALRAVALADPEPTPPAEVEMRAIAAALLGQIDEQSRSRPADLGFELSEITLDAPVVELTEFRDVRLPRRLVAASLAIAAAIALVVFVTVSRDDDSSELDVIDAPPITTTIVATTVPPSTDGDADAAPAGPLSETALVTDFTEAVNSGDLDVLRAVIATDASCETGLPGPDSCGDFWGNTLAIGGRIELRNCRPAVGPFDERCDLSMTSELHTVMGFDGFDPGGSVLLRTDTDGGLIPLPQIDPTGSFLDPAGQAEFRLWAYMVERYPELSINPMFGPVPYDYESGLKMLEAGRELNDPIRLAGEVEAGLDAGGSFGELVQESGFFRFLDAVNADLEFDCSGRETVGGQVSCPATLVTDVHRTLGSGPVETTLTVAARGGLLATFEPVLLWFDDPTLQADFIAFGRDRGNRFTADNSPVFNLGTVEDWLATAVEYAGAAQT